MWGHDRARLYGFEKTCYNKNEEDPNTRVYWSDCQALGWHFKAAVFRGLTDAASYEAMAVNVIVSSVSIILHK